MNRVPPARRVQIINCLVEGSSIRSTERMTGTHRDTICRLLVEIGDGCAHLMDEQMREVSCRRIQVDEIWAYVGKKQAHLKEDDDRSRLGDQWTFVALDPETKLIPSYRVGKRDGENAVAFMTDLSERLADRVQISSDALAAYVDAVERAFGADVLRARGKILRARASRVGSLLAAQGDGAAAHRDRRQPRSRPYLDKPRGAAKPHDAHVDAP